MNRDLDKYVILHSNDLHGDFLADKLDEKLVGGVARLSGYIKQVNKEEDHVSYFIAGDMFKGSIIDSAFLGLSTIAIMNYLSPDVVCIGNHEIDYGISHSLLIEKCANFEVINANMYMKYFNKRLYKPYTLISSGKHKVLVIGLITEEVIKQIKNDHTIGEIVEVRDAKKEVEKIVKEVGRENFYTAILLTHIGIDADIELAKSLDKDLGVSMIIGGHSHTFMEKPLLVNDIAIMQAGIGTKQIGRLELLFDRNDEDYFEYNWNSVPIDDNCPLDDELDDYVNYLKDITNQKYNKVVLTLDREIHNDVRNKFTEVAALFADAFNDEFDSDITIFQAGSLRKTKMGPEVTYKDILEMYAFKDPFYEIRVNGKDFKRMLEGYMKVYNPLDTHCSILDISSNLELEYSVPERRFTKINYKGKELKDDESLKVGLISFLYTNFEEEFKAKKEEVIDDNMTKTLTKDSQETIIAYFSNIKKINAKDTSRFVIKEA